MKNIFNTLTAVSENLSFFIVVLMFLAVVVAGVALVAMVLLNFSWVLKMTVLTLAMIVLKPLRWIVNGLYNFVSESGKQTVARRSIEKE